MKKFFIALSVLAALMFSVVPSQAIMGVADVDALGTDAIVPFVTDLDYTGRTGLNTLMVFTDVLGAGADGLLFHYTVYTSESETVYNDNLKGTEYDIVPTDAYTVIAKLAPTERAKLEVDLDGDGTNDHYAGYIWFDNNSLNVNTVGGQFLFVDLAKGLVASCNIPMKEYHNNLGQPVGADMVGNDMIELFNPEGLAGAENLQLGATTAVNPLTFGIYPRFYIPASGDATLLIFWASANADVSGLGGGTGALHINWFDDEENYVSSNIPIPWELNVINVEPLLPNSLFPANTYPKEGWIQLAWLTNTPALDDLEMLGWTFLQAYGSLGAQNTSWAALNEMWRDVTWEVE